MVLLIRYIDRPLDVFLIMGNSSDRYVTSARFLYNKVLNRTEPGWIDFVNFAIHIHVHDRSWFSNIGTLTWHVEQQYFAVKRYFTQAFRALYSQINLKDV